MKTSSVRIQGPLVLHVGGFYAELRGLGYKHGSAIMQLRLMAHVSRWLENSHLGPQDMTETRVEQFLKARRDAGYAGWRTLRGLTPLLTYLRRLRVAPDAPVRPPSETEILVLEFCDYLRSERGLATRSIECYRPFVLEFLTEQFPSGRPKPRELSAENITQFVLKKGRRRSVRHVKSVSCALRSFLRFLHVRWDTAAPLVAAVPAIASWRLASLPRPVELKTVKLLLDTCDRRTSPGRRTYAVLLLLARLGLRSSEVSAIQLDDIYWRSGEILIRGKGGRNERLPLPADVGAAMAAYAKHARPRTTTRSFFLRRFAPIGPLTRVGVQHLVALACERADIPKIGAHRLRHTAATEMLRGGARLSSIAQVLRHRSTESTAIYAKVDRNSLRELAQPWPEELR